MFLQLSKVQLNLVPCSHFYDKLENMVCCYVPPNGTIDKVICVLIRYMESGEESFSFVMMSKSPDIINSLFLLSCSLTNAESMLQAHRFLSNVK